MGKCIVIGCESPIRARKLCSRHYSRYKKYGEATIKERLTNEQGGLCAICHRPEVLEIEGTSERIGLLCHRCRSGVRNFSRSPTLLKAAAEFIGQSSMEPLEREMFSEWESQLPEQSPLITLYLDDYGDVKVVAPSLSFFLTRAMMERGLEIVTELYDVAQMIAQQEDDEES